MVFTSIGHLLNKELLQECHKKMEKGKAVGIDGVTKEEYGQNLEENLENLLERLKRKSYKPQPARRVDIPKENGKTRPLSIYSYEDKLVQEALKRILEAVFEPHFYEEMMGFRPNRGCHKAIQKLNVMLEKRATNYVLDADIQGFFDHIDHAWAIKFIESRIKDPNILRLVKRMLKSGVLKEYQWEATEEGSGQGSVCSPMIANIYMHYVLVWWFKECIQPKLRGYSGLVVYADDFVFCFQYQEEAEKFYDLLKRRMKHFGMTLEENKTRLIEFGKYAEGNCSKNSRTQPLESIIKKLNQILVGYYHYYGITDNIQSLSNFRFRVIRSLFQWLNRRSQKKSYTWEEFNEMLKQYKIATPKIYVSVYEGSC